MKTTFFLKKTATTSSPFGFKNRTIGLLTKSVLFLFLLTSSVVGTAQDQFLWASDAPFAIWENASNWMRVPPTGPPIATSVYPGQVSPMNDVALFSNAHNGNCRITKFCAGTTTALRVGGIIVKGYKGTIYQDDDNRFNVAESMDAGGAGFWDGTSVITTSLPTFSGMTAYQAHFEFDITAGSMGFQGGANPSLGGLFPNPSYALLFAVPVTVLSGRFKAPKDETRIRHDIKFINGSDFDNDHEGAVVFSNRTAGAGTRYYDVDNVRFWDIKVTPNGALPRVKEFSGLFRAEHNFMTTGSLGVLYGPSLPIVMNGGTGTAVHIQQDLIVGNIFPGPSYTNATAFGDLLLVMKGTAPEQFITQTHSPANFVGNLPSVRIDKGAGVVTLKGAITINNELTFGSGIVRPDPFDIPTSQNDLNTPNNLFVVNSNTTISGASDASYCEGPIRIRTGKKIELPVGKNGIYRPALIDPIAGVSIDYSSDNMYTAEYFDMLPAEPIANRETGLNAVSNCEVWAIQKMNNTTDALELDLELSYDAISGSCTSFLYDDICKVVVTRWDVSDNIWKSHGNDGGSGTGHGDLTLRSDLSFFATDFERGTTRPDLFTFGRVSEAACVSCDVSVCVNYCFSDGEFIFNTDFTTGDGTTVIGGDWNFGDGTGTGLSTTHTFTSGGLKPISVTFYAISGGEPCSITYDFFVYNNICTPPMESIVQPKSNKVAPLKSVKETAKLNVYPNPTSQGVIQLNLEKIGNKPVNYMIVDALGQKVMEGQLIEGQQTLNTKKLTSGTYNISIQLKDGNLTKSFIVVNE